MYYILKHTKINNERYSNFRSNIFIYEFFSGGHLQLSSSVPVHWSNSEGPDSKYSNRELTSNYSQKELQNTSSQQGNISLQIKSIFYIREIYIDTQF